jgi:hypothetical protein
MSARGRVFATTLFACSLIAEVRAEAPRLIRSQEVAILLDQPILQEQYDVLSKMSSVDVTYDRLGLLYRLEGFTGIVFSDAFRRLQLGEAAPEALEKLGSILLATGTETFVVRRNDVPEPYRRIVLEQSIRGIPVLGGLSDIDLDETSGMLRIMHSRFVPDRGLRTGPRLTGQKAYERTVEYLESAGWAEPKSVQLQRDPTLAYFAGMDELQRPSLIWVVLVEYLKPIEGSDERYAWIDAIDGTCRGITPVGRESTP